MKVTQPADAHFVSFSYVEYGVFMTMGSPLLELIRADGLDRCVHFTKCINGWEKSSV